MPIILTSFLEAGIPGTIVIDCHGALRRIEGSDIEPPPVFGSLRHFLNPKYTAGKLMLTVLHDDQVSAAKTVIKNVVGDLTASDTGVMFTISVTSAEGIERK